MRALSGEMSGLCFYNEKGRERRERPSSLFLCECCRTGPERAPIAGPWLSPGRAATRTLGSQQEQFGRAAVTGKQVPEAGAQAIECGPSDKVGAPGCPGWLDSTSWAAS